MPDEDRNVSRRNFLKATGLGVGSLAAAFGLGRLGRPSVVVAQPTEPAVHDHGNPGMMGQVDNKANQFDPHELLTDFDYGEVSEENGQTVRTWQILAVDKEIEIAPGIFFPAWVYGSATSAASRRQGLVVGQCPGPTLRCIEGELLRLVFVNGSSHPHTIHFHGIHSAFMDGIPNVGRGVIEPGEQFTYEFVARPFGCHLYHCHAFPLKRHIHKGLYGAFIVDPDPAKYSGAERELAIQRNHQTMATDEIHEMVMVMNGFDTNFDGDNEVYAVNSIAFAYGMQRPIVIQREQRQRIYLVNVTEFDPINSLHTHANFFDYYDHGTTLLPTQKTVDTIMQCQAQRGIIELSFADFEPGLYMFHAHQSEFAELGWMGFFELQA